MSTTYDHDWPVSLLFDGQKTLCAFASAVVAMFERVGILEVHCADGSRWLVNEHGHKTRLDSPVVENHSPLTN